MSDVLKIRPAADVKWDCVSFGEIMLRFDPGFGRVRTARQFQVWEGGGEYNVARAMRKCWGKRASVVTALPRNDLGWLVEDFICQGGVDTSHIIWRDFDGLGRNTRVGRSGDRSELVRRAEAQEPGFAHIPAARDHQRRDRDQRLVGAPFAEEPHRAFGDRKES